MTESQILEMAAQGSPSAMIVIVAIFLVRQWLTGIREEVKLLTAEVSKLRRDVTQDQILQAGRAGTVETQIEELDRRVGELERGRSAERGRVAVQ